VPSLLKTWPSFPPNPFVAINEPNQYPVAPPEVDGELELHESAASLNEAVINLLQFGGAPMSPGIARKALQLLCTSVNERIPRKASLLPDTISSREKEILQHTVNGLDAKRIATLLNISVFTVRKHVANIYEKLHVQSKAQIIKLAHNNKWFNL
jgi:DNA-binding NarL/FixJ family response regulator